MQGVGMGSGSPSCKGRKKIDSDWNDEVQPVTGLQQVKINVVCVGHTYEHSRFKVHSVTKLSQAPGKLHLP